MTDQRQEIDKSTSSASTRGPAPLRSWNKLNATLLDKEEINILLLFQKSQYTCNVQPGTS